MPWPRDTLFNTDTHAYTYSKSYTDSEAKSNTAPAPQPRTAFLALTDEKANSP